MCGSRRGGVAPDPSVASPQMLPKLDHAGINVEGTWGGPSLSSPANTIPVEASIDDSAALAS